MKTLPNDIKVEKMLIGALLINLDLKGKVLNNITTEDFYSEDHKAILEAISCASPNIGSIVGQIKHTQNGKSDKLIDYVFSLIEESNTSAGIDNYVDIVKDLSTRRKIVIACMDAKNRINDMTNETGSIISDLKNCIQSSTEIKDGDYRTSLELVDVVYKDIEYRKGNNDHSIGMECGISAIDDNVGGFEGKTLTYLIARPSMGKTALSLNMAENMAMSEQGMVVYFSLEMGDVQIMRRRLSAISQVPLTRIRHGNIDDSQWPGIIEACNDLSNSKMIVVDKPKYKNIERLISLTHAISMEHKIACVYVDHVQLVSSSKTFQSTHAELTYISNELKALAKDLNIPVIALSQLNRKIEERRDKKPLLSDMRESGSLEQDADIVIGIYRETPESETMLLCGLKGRDIGIWKSTIGFDRFTQKTKLCQPLPEY